VVEHLLAKEGVASSSLVSRSTTANALRHRGVSCWSGVLGHLSHSQRHQLPDFEAAALWSWQYLDAGCVEAPLTLLLHKSPGAGKSSYDWPTIHDIPS
jgi:hypothetical protein